MNLTPDRAPSVPVKRRENPKTNCPSKKKKVYNWIGLTRLRGHVFVGCYLSQVFTESPHAPSNEIIFSSSGRHGLRVALYANLLKCPLSLSVLPIRLRFSRIMGGSTCRSRKWCMPLNGRHWPSEIRLHLRRRIGLIVVLDSTGPIQLLSNFLRRPLLLPLDWRDQLFLLALVWFLERDW